MKFWKGGRKTVAGVITHKNDSARPRRWLFISSGLSLLIILSAVGLFLYDNQVSAQIAVQNKELQIFIDSANKQLEEIAARKAAEEKARKVALAHELAEKSKNSNESIAQTIDASICSLDGKHNDSNSLDVIVNKKQCIQPLLYSPADLVTVNGATLRAVALDNYNKMYEAAVKDGQAFRVTSSFRSYSAQVSTYGHWVATSGWVEADTYSARPGYSEHQTGLVIDVAAGGCALDCFGSTSQYQWFQNNAANYGFIQRYYAGSENVTGYKSEEWHYRYVGVDVAKDMQQKGIKTLEEYWGVEGGDYH